MNLADAAIRGDNMKIGIRKPSIKKRIKARTTSKLKRKTKKAINPLYGTKTAGALHPVRKVKNKVYKKTTFDIFKIFK